MSKASEVVSRVLTEEVISVSDARKKIGEVTGQMPGKQTIHNWINRGVGGVKLEAVRIGNSVFTSSQAINRFITARTATI